MNFLEKIKNFWGKLEKKQKWYVIVFGVVTFILLWAFISAGVITHNFNRNVLNDSADNQELEVKGMILTESKEGQKAWEIYGESGDYSADLKTATLNNIIGNFYKDNKVNMSFQATRGTYNEDTRNIDLYENIYVVMENDVTITADHITYFSESKTIKATGNVKINRQGTFIATADEAVVNSTFDIFKIQGNTISQIYENNTSKKTQKGLL